MERERDKGMERNRKKRKKGGGREEETGAKKEEREVEEKEELNFAHPPPAKSPAGTDACISKFIPDATAILIAL